MFDKILLVWDLQPLTLVVERLRHLVVQLGYRPEPGHFRDGRLLLPLVATGAAGLIRLGPSEAVAPRAGQRRRLGSLDLLDALRGHLHPMHSIDDMALRAADGVARVAKVAASAARFFVFGRLHRFRSLDGVVTHGAEDASVDCLYRL